MVKRVGWGGLVLMFATVWSGLAHAQSVGAKSSGDWGTGSIWTSGSAPGSSNNVYIGGNTPTGAASTATVTLTTNEAAANL